jgi:acetyltransferase-like isoleucine patch superfamily enzyme
MDVIRRLNDYIYDKLILKYYTIMTYFTCRYHGIPWNMTMMFKGKLIIRKSKGAKIDIGDNFTSISDMKYNTFGIIQKVLIAALEANTQIIIGNNVGISGCTITARRYIKIGNDVLIGSGVIITDNDAHPIKPCNRRFSDDFEAKPIIIGDNAFIGARAIILKGVTIGTGAVVGAGSVVSKNVEPFSVVGGNPAVFIKDCRD